MESKPKFWSNNLWLICLSHLLLSVSLYMLIPTLPVWLADRYGAGRQETGGTLAIVCIVAFVLGPFFNYLVDRFPRKNVCAWALIGVAACSLGFFWAPALSWMFTLRVAQGLLYGVALMASGSTLAIDLTSSPRRTEANNAFVWFGRLGLSIGPLTGMLVQHLVGFCLALLALRFVFLNADVRSEIVSGNIVWGAGLLLLIFRHDTSAFYVASALIGIGIGLTTARLLVFFIKLSQHCERGSANTSYLFAWELGIGIGLYLGYAVLAGPVESYRACLWILAGALLFYLAVAHRWFMAHKVR